MNKKRSPVPAKMKIVLSPIPQSEDHIKIFMERVNADVARLPSSDAVKRTVSTLGQVLKITKTIMDQLSKVHYQRRCRSTLVNRLNLLIRHTRYSMHRGPLFPVFTR